MEYVTQECYDRMTEELHELMTVERPRIANAIADARDKGDLSENFEYHAAKREQGKLEGRIDRLKLRILRARVVDTSQLQTDCVGLLSTVELTDLTHDRKMTYTLVNPSEANIAEHKISVHTPIAKGLMQKRVGDVAVIKVPAGELRLRVDKISVQ